uniref:WW domain-containing protein n=1 Tax=Scylla olivacea TaxID=85551 RepID=A0A0P4W9F1_SCYOL
MASSWESFIASSSTSPSPTAAPSTSPPPPAPPAPGPPQPPQTPNTAPPQQYPPSDPHQQPHAFQYSQTHYQGLRMSTPTHAVGGGAGPTTPAPQTPIGGPPGGGPGVQETDLPPEMLAVGWRKFWSKREQRVYFWNRSTGESLWDMPGPAQSHGQPPGQVGSGHHPHPNYDPISDPLGIQNPANGGGGAPNTATATTTITTSHTDRSPAHTHPLFHPSSSFPLLSFHHWTVWISVSPSLGDLSCLFPGFGKHLYGLVLLAMFPVLFFPLLCQ